MGDIMPKMTRLAALLLLCATAALPQTGGGMIQGTIKDATGAVIPGAQVTILHEATTREYRTATNEAGFYAFPPVQPGEYRITAENPGMEKWQGSLTLQVSQTAVVNPVLRVSGTATEIVVAGNVTPIVTTENPTLGTVLERQRIEQLPLNGRFLQTLIATTTPGVEASGNPRVMGLREGSMEFLQDGAVLNSIDKGGVASRPPGIDTVQEFTVETNNSSAKMNRPASAIIVTKGGTNQLHGAAFETVRNNSFGIARHREDFYEKAPHLVRNEFGASAGGPVILPKIYNGRNRTFFFFAWEALRQMQGSTSATGVPTLAMRQGDFSQTIDSSGRLNVIYDPWSTGADFSRTPFVGNQIPTSRQSPVAKYYFGITPNPTNTNNPLVSDNFFGPGINDRRDHTETVRIDHRLGDRDQIFGRYTHGNNWRANRRTSQTDYGSPVLLDNSGNIDIVPARDESGVFTWTHTFSPTFFSETIFNGSSEDYMFHAGMDTTKYADLLGLPNPTGRGGLPDVTFTAAQTVTVPGGATTPVNSVKMTYTGAKPRNIITKIFNLNQNFTKIHGRHELQFGGLFRYEPLSVYPDQSGVEGSYTFDVNASGLYDKASGTSYSAVSRTGFNVASFYMGLPATASENFSRGWWYLSSYEYAGYLQDNFKLTSRLTLNLGLRLEMFPPYHETNGTIFGFDQKTHKVVLGSSIEKMQDLGYINPDILASYRKAGVQFESAKDAGLPSTLINNNGPNFNPRAGFAYKLFNGSRPTVLRGGFAIYSAAIPMRTFYSQIAQAPPVFGTVQYSSIAANQSPDGLPNYSLRSVPSTILGVNSKNLLDPKTVTIQPGNFKTTSFDPDEPVTLASQWNLTLEREIFDNTLLRIGYTGNHGSNLEMFNDINTNPNTYVWYKNTGLPLPTGALASAARRPFDNTVYGDVVVYNKTGWSNYNGLQIELRHRYSKGYGFQVFYVLSNALKAGGLGTSFFEHVFPTSSYLNGAMPDDYNQRLRLTSYRRDDTIPQHRLSWNWIVDLPVGRGKKLAGNAGGVLNRIVGGWQLAGFGSVNSNYWALPTDQWGALGNVEIYGTKYKIQDCRSGACIPGYLFYNGYIPANRINSYDAKGNPNGVMGVPDNYRPATQPVNPIPANGGASDPNFDTNNVFITLKNGTSVKTTVDSNLHPWRNQFVPGPLTWGLDASLFKTIPIKESVSLRFNADFFNVLNMPGLNQPTAATGILSLQNSSNSPRQLQLTLRLIW